MLEKEALLRRKARVAAPPKVTGGTWRHSPRCAPVRVVGAVDAPIPGARYDAIRPGAPDGPTLEGRRQLTPPVPT